MGDRAESTESILVTGRNAVRELLEDDPARIVRVMLSRNLAAPVLRAFQQASKYAGVPAQIVPYNRLEREAKGVNHQGVIALLAAQPYVDVDEMLRATAPLLGDVQDRKPIILILDHIQDSHNLGAIIRTAVASGVSGIVIPDRGAAPLNTAAVKTSAGAATRIPVARVSSLTALLSAMKERGYWIAGADTMGDTSVWEMDWNRPIGLVIGGEEGGMGHAVRKACDFLVTIPMTRKTESLNASVAAGVLLFSAAKSRLTTE